MSEQLPKPEGRGPDSFLGGLEGEGGTARELLLTRDEATAILRKLGGDYYVPYEAGVSGCEKLKAIEAGEGGRQASPSGNDVDKAVYDGRHVESDNPAGGPGDSGAVQRGDRGRPDVQRPDAGPVDEPDSGRGSGAGGDASRGVAAGPDVVAGSEADGPPVAPSFEGERGASLIPSADGTVTLSLADFPPDFLDYLKAVAGAKRTAPFYEHHIDSDDDLCSSPSGEREGATPRCTCGRNVEGDWHTQDCPLSVREGEPCKPCHGTGGEPDMAVACDSCGGSGVVAGTAPSPVLYDELREAVVAQLEKLRPDRKLRKSDTYWDGYDDAMCDAIDVAEGNPTVGQVVALSEHEMPSPAPKEDN